jgi:replicative DNA helicase
MKTLARAVAQADSMGTRIHLPWRALNQLVTLRTGELVIIGGAAGGGKSTLAANMAINMTDPMLYCAQDSPASVLSRMTALALGTETGSIQVGMTDEEERAIIASRLEDVRPSLVFHRGPITVAYLKEMCIALREWMGIAPRAIIIDNLIDLMVAGRSHHETTFYSVALPELKRLALEQDTCIIALHHVTRGGGSKHGRGEYPMMITDLLYAGEREARHVWGVYNDGGGNIYVQVLKQQDGRADPDGGLRVQLHWYPKLGKLASVEVGV